MAKKPASVPSSAFRSLIFLSLLLMLALAILLVIAYERFKGGADLSWLPELPGEKPVEAQHLPADMGHYYSLKNLSCQTLSKNFLIEARDHSSGSLEGIITDNPDEEAAAVSIASGYDADLLTRTYVRGTWMKKVIHSSSGNHTTIWKEGRVYQCDDSCTMNLLGDAGWQAYLDTLERMREGCMHFGRTALPDDVDLPLLLRIENTGLVELNGFRCERFSVFGNKTYADTLLASNQSAMMSDDQRALLWAITHLKGPVEECLDDGTGVLVYRSLVLDLTPTYRFDYSPGGGMFISQETNVTYYSTDVPESFFGLPGNT